MPKLIDAEMLWKVITTRIEEYCDIADLIEIIETQPTVDAVEVVRCKDCVHSGQCTKEIVMKMRVGSYLYCPMGNEGFCSHGERKEDAEEE